MYNNSIVLFLLLFSAIKCSYTVSDTEWTSFKKQYDKNYSANLEDWIRRELYQDSIDEVNEFNAKQTIRLGFKIGLNQFSDLTKVELKRLGGTRTTANIGNSPKAQQFLNNILNDSSEIIPDYVDWRKQTNVVGRVKNQGKCRSSWAFAATGVLEGQVVKRNWAKNFAELSEQNLIDCVSGNSGCNVGLVEPSFWYAQNEGLMRESDYLKFTGIKSNCKSDNNKSIVIRDRGYAILPEGDEKALKKVVALYGPVAAIIPMGEEMLFYKYKSGIFYNNNSTQSNDYCRTKQNHAVLIVGYGRDFITGGDYWIVKNSYGKSWGEEGYMRMARNRKNNSGIACNAMIAIF